MAITHRDSNIVVVGNEKGVISLINLKNMEKVSKDESVSFCK